VRSIPDGATAVVDCLSLWVSNLIESRLAPEIEAPRSQPPPRRTLAPASR